MDVDVDSDPIFAGTQTTSPNTPSSSPPAATSPLNASFNALLEAMDAPNRPPPHPSTRSSTSALQQAPITLATPTEPSPASITRLTPFAASFLALPPEILTHILLYLAPDDLGILSRLIAPLAGVERDRYLWAVWVHSTAPSRVRHALWSPLRPDPIELVRRGTLRGVAIINGVRAGGYWASPSAVRLSVIHDTLSRRSLRRHLSHALHLRPSRPALIKAGILPAVSDRGASPSICARAHALERAKARDAVRQALRSQVGQKSFAEAISLGHWKDAGQRVLLALCPSIQGRREFFEGLGKR